MDGAFDDRLVTVDIDAGDQQFSFDQSYYILATGTKFTDGSIGEAAVRIDNIDKKTRDYLVNKTSPWNPQRSYVNLTLSVGRKSKGTFVLFTGQCRASNPSQPPDIGLTFTALAMGAQLGNIGSLSGGATNTLRAICVQIAAQLPNPMTGQAGIPLDYPNYVVSPQIQNYSFNGPLIKQIDKINALGYVDAAIDNNTLTVRNRGQGTMNTAPKIISRTTGMVGVPEVNELGVRVTVLIYEELKGFDQVTIQSLLNAAANGTFYIYQLGFEVASRETPFYWLAETRPFVLGAAP